MSGRRKGTVPLLPLSLVLAGVWGPWRRGLGRRMTFGKQRAGNLMQARVQQGGSDKSLCRPTTFPTHGLAKQPARHRRLGHGRAPPAPVGPDHLTFLLPPPSVPGAVLFLGRMEEVGLTNVTSQPSCDGRASATDVCPTSATLCQQTNKQTNCPTQPTLSAHACTVLELG